MRGHGDRITGWLSLWLIAAVVWGFTSGHAAQVLTVSGVFIVVYAVTVPVFERRNRKRYETNGDRATRKRNETKDK